MRVVGSTAADNSRHQSRYQPSLGSYDHGMRALTAVASFTTLLLITVACGQTGPSKLYPTAATATSSATTPVTRPMSSAAASGPALAPVDAADVAGRVVFLDPGHNGANDSSINRQVSNGRGGTKECQTSGTTTNEGYPEHTFNWDVVLKIQSALNALGVQTVLSRNNDDALGPCVDERAGSTNAIRPDAIVSIHADGGPATGRGFHVNYSSPPLNDAQAGPAIQLAHTMRDELVASGFDESTYIGSDGLYGRADLAGLNLAQYPAILIGLGNMRNGDDAARMESEGGETNYAAAITRGIAAYLVRSLPVQR